MADDGNIKQRKLDFDREFYAAIEREEYRRRVNAILFAVGFITVGGILFGIWLYPYTGKLAPAHISSEFEKGLPVFGALTITLTTMAMMTAWFLNRENRRERSLAEIRLNTKRLWDDLTEKSDELRRDGSVSATNKLIDNLIRAGSRSEDPEHLRRPSDYLDVLVQFRTRMHNEEQRLRANSTANLFWGLIFSALALGTLLLFIFITPLQHFSNITDFIAMYGPRASVPIIMELVSFFFLRLYGSLEQEIKHNKNEVTNMEAKFAAAMMVQTTGAASNGRAEVVKRLASVERNFVLKKGEKTAGAEGGTEYNDFRELLLEAVRVGTSATPKNRAKE